MDLAANVNVARLVCILLSVLLAGCIATPRSNTARYDEKVQIGLLEVGRASPKAVEATFPDIAIAIGKAILEWEGSKYEQVSTGELRESHLSDYVIPDKSEGWVLKPVLRSNAGERAAIAYITVLRTLKEKKGIDCLEQLGLWLTWFERPTNLEPLDEGMKSGLVERVHAWDSRLPEREVEKAFGFSPVDPPDPYFGFAALFQIVPTIPVVGDGNCANFRIELVDYRYSALKAKNLSWIRVPFTDWETTKSVIAVSLRGPQNDVRFGGRQYEATAEFDLQWDREKSSDNKPSEWKNPSLEGSRGDGTNHLWKCGQSGGAASLSKSPPIRAFDFRNIGVTVKLSEAGPLKKAFEQASEKIGDLN